MKVNVPLFILLGCAVLFAVGLVRLFELRFESGDVYPPYSTLRSDPLGAMAFYESLGRMKGLSIQRDFSMENRLPEAPHTVYLQLGGDAYEWNSPEEDLTNELKSFLIRGNRLVVTFFPQTSWDEFRDDFERTNSMNSGRDDHGQKRMARDKSSEKMPFSPEDTNPPLWGLHVSFAKLDQAGDTYAPARAIKKTDLPLPRTLDWHSGIVFTNLDRSWRVIYARGSAPVVIERRVGQGSIVMATDSYFVSNEAMDTDRHADLLAWLIGSSQNVVFDESHFGIIESSGVAMLMRKYRLHGLAAGLVLLAGLFIWKNANSLVPPHSERERRDYVAGRDSAAGFVNLLRRSLPAREVLSICFSEWKKSGAPDHYSASRRQQAEAAFQAEKALPPREQNPVLAYKKICSVLESRNAPSKS